MKRKVDGGEDPGSSSTDAKIHKGSSDYWSWRNLKAELLRWIQWFLLLLLQTFPARVAPASPHLPLSLSPSDRFQQLEVFHQVTTAFSSLGRTSTSRRAHPDKELPPQATERRRHVAALFRRAASKRNRPASTGTAEAASAASDASEVSAASAAPRPPRALAGDKNLGFIKGAVEQQDGPENQEPSQKASWPVKEKPPTFLRGPPQSPGMVTGASETKVSQAAF